jgi:hypothetical protein
VDPHQHAPLDVAADATQVAGRAATLTRCVAASMIGPASRSAVMKCDVDPGQWRIMMCRMEV